MATINLNVYRENKDIIKNLNIINGLMIDKFPDKSAGWVGLTTLFYSQTAIMKYLELETNLDPKFIPAVKAVLWEFLKEISSYESRKGKE